MTIPPDGVTPAPEEVETFNAVLVGGPMAGQLVHVPDTSRPYLAADDNGGHPQEYRPDGTTAFADGQDTGLPVFRHYAPAETSSAD